MANLVYTLVSVFVYVWVIDISQGSFECRSPGKFFYPQDPMKYHECHFVGDNQFVLLLQTCPEGSCFDAASVTCVFDACYRPEDDSTMSAQPISNFTCSAAGKFPHEDASRNDAFYKCINIQGKLFVYEYQCLPAKPCFNSVKQSCQPC